VSQDGEEEAAVGANWPGTDAELLEVLEELFEPPHALVASAKMAPDIVALDESYLELVQSEAIELTRGPARTYEFRSSQCRLTATVEDVGAAAPVLEGRITGTTASEVIHERMHDAHVVPVDDRGYFTLNPSPTGFGRLVVRTADGRRLPAAWVIF
jgi:hypothetical protein